MIVLVPQYFPMFCELRFLWKIPRPKTTTSSLMWWGSTMICFLRNVMNVLYGRNLQSRASDETGTLYIDSHSIHSNSDSRHHCYYCAIIGHSKGKLLNYWLHVITCELLYVYLRWTDELRSDQFSWWSSSFPHYHSRGTESNFLCKVWGSTCWLTWLVSCIILGKWSLYSGRGEGLTVTSKKKKRKMVSSYYCLKFTKLLSPNIWQTGLQLTLDKQFASKVVCETFGESSSLW